MAKAKKSRRAPILGPAFDCDQRDDVGRIQGYIAELQYYRPRGFSKLVREAASALRGEASDEWKTDVESLLTAWARRVERHDFISYGPFPQSGDVGFSIDVDSAQSEADLRLDAGDDVPAGFSGLAVFVNDHGNVHAATYSRGRKCRELFAVV